MISPHHKVLIIEDDEIYRFELSDFLIQEGYEVFQATTGHHIVNEIDRHQINLLILDLSLPGLNGFEIAETVKSVYPSVGIILLTGRTARTDRIEGYNRGADIYLAKSTVDYEEILAAIGSLERRFETVSTNHSWSIHVDSGMLTNTQSGTQLQLTISEALLIKLLIPAPNRVLESETIISEIERHQLRQSPDKRSLENIVSRLKVKIATSFGVDQKSHPIIRPVRGIGYQLIYPIVLSR